MPWPTAEDEVWRYSRVAELDLDRYRPLVAASPSEAGSPRRTPPKLDRLVGAMPDAAAVVVLHNGEVVRTELADGVEARGVRVAPVAERADGEDLLGSVAATQPDVFGVLNDAFALAPVVVDVPDGVALEQPVVVVSWVDVDGGAAFDRLVVRTGADAEVAVLTWQASDDDCSSASFPVIELDAGPASRLRYLDVQDRGSRAWQIGRSVARAQRDATVVVAQAALGGDYARTRSECRLEGRGAHGDLLAVYFGEREQMLDFRTFQDHLAPDTTSNLLFKGAVGGRSHSVYTGTIHVAKEARGTNALQTNRNLKLSDGAWAESVPNLEIENNDVRCSHASAVGPIDADQRFYLESRGVPTAVAERLVVAGFFDEVLDRMPVRGAADSVAAEIGRRLERQDIAGVTDGNVGIGAPGEVTS